MTRPELVEIVAKALFATDYIPEHADIEWATFGDDYREQATAAIDAIAAVMREPAPDEWRLSPDGDQTTLVECPVGLFVNSYGNLCMKTEYGNNEGRIDAYIVDSGEMFWGKAPQTIESQRAEIIQPLTAAAFDASPLGEKR